MVATKKTGGTFATMGLSRLVLKAVERKGYKLATPIQRKCIPTIMEGRDVVAMARTGSGKSAAFLLPIIDKLKIRQPKSSIRVLIVSPTRELSMQTFKFAREFSKYTNLVIKYVIGGESIGKDFETITSCPDILIATPGRLAHVLVEMKHKLNDVEVAVFDEADRLFEPGFKEIEQVNEILMRLPDTKQTLLFSATMPQKLADFAKAGMKNPVFVRLDVESNLSDSLKSMYLHCAHNDKFAALLHLLKNFVTKEQMTVVFMPTKHHIEYAKLLLQNLRIDCCYVYSSLDPEERKINISRFTKKICRVMLVTDIAARGIDIPMLDIVINYNFPSKPKLFIHRVGRVARAGRSGCAISLVSHDETAYLHALHIFLDTELLVASRSDAKCDPDNLPDRMLGAVPQNVIDEENEVLRIWHEHDVELKSMVKVCDNAMKPYLKMREPASHYSIQSAKDIHKQSMDIHPFYHGQFRDNSDKRCNLLDRIKSYKPQVTIFEIGHIKGNNKTEAFDVMQRNRKFHEILSLKKENKTKELVSDEKLEENNIDSKYYLKYQPDNHHKEKGLELDKSSFNKDLNRVTMDLMADDDDQLKRQKHQKLWDRKKKKYITPQTSSKKIKTESGAYISASYQTGLFDKWKTRSKFDQKNPDAPEPVSVNKLRSKLKPGKRNELKNTDQILKARTVVERREAIIKRVMTAKANRKAARSKK